jgi:hypothetical protein
MKFSHIWCLVGTPKPDFVISSDVLLEETFSRTCKSTKPLPDVSQEAYRSSPLIQQQHGDYSGKYPQYQKSLLVFAS